MQTGLLHLHNILRWIVILFLLLTLIRSLLGLTSGSNFTNGDRKTALFLLISVDTQLLLGISLYFLKGWQNVLASGTAMANPASRFWSVEHWLGMLIGIVLIHIGYVQVKKKITNRAKYSRLFLYTLIAAIIMLVSIPWPFREFVGRSLFPGMGV